LNVISSERLCEYKPRGGESYSFTFTFISMAECLFQLLIFACHHSVQKATVFKANHLICHEAIKKKKHKKNNPSRDFQEFMPHRGSQAAGRGSP